MPRDDRTSESGNPTGHGSAEYDWKTTSPSTAVIETVGRATGDEPDELDPLYDWIDPDALDALFQPDATTHPLELLTVSFSYAGFTVTVDGRGRVELAGHPA